MKRNKTWIGVPFKVLAYYIVVAKMNHANENSQYSHNTGPFSPSAQIYRRLQQSSNSQDQGLFRLIRTIEDHLVSLIYEHTQLH